MNERESFEAEYSKCDLGIEGHNFKKNPDGSYESQQIYTAFHWFKKGAALASQAQQPSCTYTWNCPRCGSGKCIDESDASQAQQSQWFSVEERLPEGDVFVDVYIRSRSNTNFMQRETSVAFVSGKFKINRIFDCEYVSHWMPIPPAPEGEQE